MKNKFSKAAYERRKAQEKAERLANEQKRDRILKRMIEAMGELNLKVIMGGRYT